MKVISSLLSSVILFIVFAFFSLLSPSLAVAAPMINRDGGSVKIVKSGEVMSLSAGVCFGSHLSSGAEIWKIWASSDSGGRVIVSNIFGGVFNAGSDYPAPCIERSSSNDGKLNNALAKRLGSGVFSLSLNMSALRLGPECKSVYLNYDSNRQGKYNSFYTFKVNENGICGGPTLTPTPSISGVTNPPPTLTLTPPPSRPGKCKEVCGSSVPYCEDGLFCRTKSDGSSKCINTTDCRDDEFCPVSPTPLPGCGEVCSSNTPYCREGYFCHTADGRSGGVCRNYTDCRPDNFCPAPPTVSPVSVTPTLTITMTIAPTGVRSDTPTITPTPSLSLTFPITNTPTPRAGECFQKCIGNGICKPGLSCVDFKHNCESDDQLFPECNYCYAPKCLHGEGALIPRCVIPPSNSPTPSINISSTHNPTFTSCKFRSQSFLYEIKKNTDGIEVIEPMTFINQSNRDWYSVNNSQISRGELDNYRQRIISGGSNNWGFTSGSFIFDPGEISFPLPSAETDRAKRYEKGDEASVTLIHPSEYQVVRHFCRDNMTNKGCPPFMTDLPGSNFSSDTISGLKLDCGRSYTYGWVLEKTNSSSPIPSVSPKNTETPTPSPRVTTTQRTQNIIVKLRNSTSINTSFKLSLDPCPASPACWQHQTIPPNSEKTFRFEKVPVNNNRIFIELPKSGPLANAYLKSTTCLGEVIGKGSKNESCKLRISSDVMIGFEICGSNLCTFTQPLPPPLPSISIPPSRGSSAHKLCGTSGANPRCCICTVGACSVDNLVRFFTDSPGKSARQKAENAAVICSRESGCASSTKRNSENIILNDGCISGRSCDYSVGPFQINVLPRCPTGISYNCSSSTKSYSCNIKNATALKNCRMQFGFGDSAIKELVKLSNNGTNWRPWAASGVCNVK